MSNIDEIDSSARIGFIASDNTYNVASIAVNILKGDVSHSD